MCIRFEEMHEELLLKWRTKHWDTMFLEQLSINTYHKSKFSIGNHSPASKTCLKHQQYLLCKKMAHLCDIILSITLDGEYVVFYCWAGDGFKGTNHHKIPSFELRRYWRSRFIYLFNVYLKWTWQLHWTTNALSVLAQVLIRNTCP